MIGTIGTIGTIGMVGLTARIFAYCSVPMVGSRVKPLTAREEHAQYMWPSPERVSSVVPILHS
eukprot:SAG31_NODE_4303_length_3370_cov_1.742281_4_plen_63_part_00